MKSKIINLKLLILFTIFSSESTVIHRADDIIGVWLSQEKTSKIEIYKFKGLYYGRIIWLKNPYDPKTGKPKIDVHNPDPTKRKNPFMGMVILKHMKHTEKNEYHHGTIYDPTSGSEYKCNATLVNFKTLDLRGYIGFSLIGRTSVWTRIE